VGNGVVYYLPSWEEEEGGGGRKEEEGGREGCHQETMTGTPS